VGVGELDEGTLARLIELKYHGVSDAVAALGLAVVMRCRSWPTLSDCG